MKYAIETFSLTKVFSDWWGREKVCAVDNLNLQVKYNEVFGLLGPNGSGKTTTIKLLLSLLHPTKGKALVLGGDSTDPKISDRTGFMPEESYLYKYLTARETLDFYGRLFHLPARVRKMRIEALLEMVGLKAVANRPVGTFSKGMARRIGLAQALINDPDLLVLDEPTTGLDPIGTRQIKDLILQLAKRGKTILLCSHLLADVEDVCDRIAILYGGRIQAEGKVKDLLLQTNKKQFTTGPLDEQAFEKIKEIIESQQSEYLVTSPMEKLENFFIKTVTQAQLQAQPTNGAVSTTTIGDFLTTPAVEKSRQAQILDKLVSESIEPAAAAEDIHTEKVTPITAEQKTDEDLLKKLSKPAVPPKPVVKDQETETNPASDETGSQQENKTDILDELTGDGG
jgi:ABC-2 type transport system ATP-binding protein